MSPDPSPDRPTAVRLESLSKRYRIGARAKVGRNLRETIMDTVTAPLRNLKRLRRLTRFDEEKEDDSDDVVWALRDVSLEVGQGEVLGIVGRNGAGKSTLLKVLSRITEPSSGRAEVHGSVGSLLEVGTGFHPELTGRDNVYLNGAILGMEKAYIDQRFEEIVEFSGVRRFIDTPVKRYSSGMRVRLAFAVAAHLQPEVLIIDEVLSVGDAEFQKKCLGKMEGIADGGRTILFVSHNMSAVQNLCSRAVWLDGGEVQMDGRSEEVIHAYLAHFGGGEAGSAEVDLRDWPDRTGTGEVRVTGARLLDETGQPSTRLHRLRACTLEFEFESEAAHRLHLSCSVYSETGHAVLNLAHYDSTEEVVPGTVDGRCRVRVHLPSLPLNAGGFHWRIAILNETRYWTLDRLHGVLPFVVEDVPESPRPYRTPAEWGYAWAPNEWSLSTPPNG